MNAHLTLQPASVLKARPASRPSLWLKHPKQHIGGTHRPCVALHAILTLQPASASKTHPASRISLWLKQPNQH
jgi:hypothetical protein